MGALSHRIVSVQTTTGPVWLHVALSAVSRAGRAVCLAFAAIAGAEFTADTLQCRTFSASPLIASSVIALEQSPAPVNTDADLRAGGALRSAAGVAIVAVLDAGNAATDSDSNGAPDAASSADQFALRPPNAVPALFGSACQRRAIANWLAARQRAPAAL